MMAPAATAAAIRNPIKRPVRKFSANHCRISALPNSALKFGWLPDNDLGPDRSSIVQVDNVGIDQSETAGRDRASNGVRLIGAVDTVDRRTEIKRTCAHWIAGPARHEAR